MGKYFTNQIDEKITEKSSADLGTMAPETKTGKIIGSVFVNVRKGPTRDAEVIGTIAKASPVTIVDKVGDFYKVTTKKYKEGYIFSTFVEED